MTFASQGEANYFFPVHLKKQTNKQHPTPAPPSKNHPKPRKLVNEMITPPIVKVAKLSMQVLGIPLGIHP